MMKWDLFLAEKYIYDLVLISTFHRGYLNKPEATRNTIKDGWLYTGDIATIDKEGYMLVLPLYEFSDVSLQYGCIEL